MQAATDARTGKITVSPLTEGDYTVTMRQTDGYTVAEPVSTAVAPKVVYEVVDVSKKVVAASEVNAAQEDGQFGRPGGAGDTSSAPEESIQETLRTGSHHPPGNDHHARARRSACGASHSRGTHHARNH